MTTNLAALALAVLCATPPVARGAVPAVPVVPDITVIYEACPNSDPYFQNTTGCSIPADRTTYVATEGDTDTLFHELGHQFAYWVLGDTKRQLSGGMRKFARLTKPYRAADGLWVGEARTYAGLREQFADAYAECAKGAIPKPSAWGDMNDTMEFPTGYGYDPTPRRHHAVCAMIDRAGARL